MPELQDEMPEPKRQFRGCWIPAEILDLAHSNIINSGEVLLLATIDSLVSKDRGCWASNEFLAEKLGLKMDTISKMITNLKRLGLVVQVAFDGRVRELETAWSRTLPRIITGRQTRTTVLGSIGESSYAASENNPSRKRENRREEGGTGGAPPSGRTTVLGSTKGAPVGVGLLVAQFDHDAAKRIKQVLSKYESDLANIREDTIAKRIYQVRTKRGFSEDRIKQVIKFLWNHYGDEFVPKWYRADDILNFKRMEDAMLRHRDDGDTEVDDMLSLKIRNWLEANTDWEDEEPMTQEQLDQALIALGREAGSYRVGCV